MNNDDIKIFSDLLINDEYCLLYNGHFIDAVTSKIIIITKVSLIQRGELIKSQNRFAYLIAECFQNIIRHGGHKEHNSQDKPLPGFFMAKIKNHFYDLVTGNLIDDAKIDILKTRFEQVNSLSEEELKALYNKTLAEGELSEKGGAGLGLIDMARKTAQKLEYRFLNSSNQKSMFYQRLVMSSGSDTKEHESSEFNIEFGINLHKIMIDRNILVLQKSDFSRDSVLPMLKIVEENIISKKIDTSLIKVMYHILFAIIQNINHSDLKLKDRKEGIFLISKNENIYSICSGHYVASKKLKWLEDSIYNIPKKSTHSFDNTLFQGLNIAETLGIKIEDYTSLGLSKIITDKFRFSIEKIDDEASFFSIYADI